MELQTDDRLLKRALKLLTPDIFQHPVWVRFSYPSCPPEPAAIKSLTAAARQLEGDGDFTGACDLLFLCAFLQNQVHDPRAASSLEQAANIACRRRLFQRAVWSGWAAGAIWAQQGDYLRCAFEMKRLESLLRVGGDWVLADFVELVGQSVEKLAGDGLPAGEPDPRIRDPWIQTALEVLSCWGQVTPGAAGQGPVSARPSIVPRSGWRAAWTGFRAWWSQAFQPPWRDEECVLRESLSPPPAAVFEEQMMVPMLPVSGGPPGARAPEQGFVEPAEIAAETTSGGLGEPAATVAWQTQLPAPDNLPAALVEQTQGKMPDSQAAKASLAIYFLGPFRVYQDDQLVSEWASQKSLAVLKYLAANHGRPVQKEVLMEQFWAGADTEVARRNLHQAIYALRQALKRRRAISRDRPDVPYILFENECYRLNPEVDLWLDYEAFEQHASAGNRLAGDGQPESAVAEYAIAEELYQGDFLEDDLYEDWPAAQRAYLRGRCLEILCQLSEYYFQRNQYNPAIILSRKILAKDSCAEPAYSCLIRCYLAQGQRHLAIREYQNCVQALKQELNLPPSGEITALYRRILASK